MHKPNEFPLGGRPSVFEKIFTMLALLFSTGAFANLWTDPEVTLEADSGITGTRAAWLIIYFVVAILLVRHCPGFLKLFWRRRFLVALVCLTVMSSMWSEVPAVTLRRSFALIATCFFGLYLAVRYEVREQLNLLCSVFSIAILASFVFGIFHFGTPVEVFEGAWYGIFVHKNTLGRMMVLSTLVFLTAAPTHNRRHFIWIGAALSIFLLYLSDSKTAVVILLIVVSFVPLLRVLRRHSGSLTVAIVAFGCLAFFIGYVILANLTDVLDALGRDATLSGRLYLWFIAAVMAFKHPWFGYGYSAFWLGLEGPSAVLWSLVHWRPPHAHNGLLDLWLDLGVVGIVMFCLGFLVYLRRAMTLALSRSSRESEWPILFLMFILLSNITESSILKGNSALWILYVSAVFSLPQASRAVNLKARVPVLLFDKNREMFPSVPECPA